MSAMTKAAARAKGYRLIPASAFEVGLVRGEQGVRTWWNTQFPAGFPDLEHPLVQEAIIANENYLTQYAAGFP